MPDSIFNYGGTVFVIFALPGLGIIARLFGVTFKRIAKWYCYVAVFAVVVVVNSVFFPFIAGKDYFFRFAIELGAIAWLLWWGFEARQGEAKQMIASAFKRPLVIAVTAFAAAFLLACVFAVDVHAAFWSNYERGEGGFQMLHYYGFFLLLAMLFPTEEDWKNIFKFSLVAAGAMIIYGLFANLGYGNLISPYVGGTVPAGWWGKIVAGRFEGSLGNPAYVAPYLLFSMFFAAYLWCASAISKKLTTVTAWGYAILIAVFLFFFYLSQTRGAFLGLLAALFMFGGYLVFQEGLFMRKLSATIVLVPTVLTFLISQFALDRSFLSSLLLAAIAAIGIGLPTFLISLIFSRDAFLRRWAKILLWVSVVAIILLGIVYLAFIKSVTSLDSIPGARLLQISTSDSSAETRFWVWGEAWQGFLQRPVFGWGPENFTAVFDKFFNPGFYIAGQSTETWFDRAHSVFFDYLSETGLVGLLAYLGMFFIMMRDFFRRRAVAAASGTAVERIQSGLVFVMPVAYLVQGIAIFDVLPMYVPLFLFLAFASFYVAANNHHESHA